MELQKILEITIWFIAIIIGIMYVYWQIKKDGLRKFIIDMIIKAEDTYLKGQNEAKMNYVIDKVIEILPFPIRLFATRDLVRNLIQIIFDEIKTALDYQVKN